MTKVWHLGLRWVTRTAKHLVLRKETHSGTQMAMHWVIPTEIHWDWSSVKQTASHWGCYWEIPMETLMGFHSA
jgi:hypothetical protein